MQRESHEFHSIFPNIQYSELRKYGHRATGHRLFLRGIPRFQHYALSSYALTCALLRYLEGGVESGFNPAQPEVFHTQLLHLRKTKKDGIVTSEASKTNIKQRDAATKQSGDP